MVDQTRVAPEDDADLQDTLYDVLADARRRAALRYLNARGTPVSTGDLAAEVAAGEHGVAADAVTDDQRAEMDVVLRHVHLPKLHEAGIVAWDAETDRVALTRLLEEVSLTTPMTGSLIDASVSVRRA